MQLERRNPRQRSLVSAFGGASRSLVSAFGEPLGASKSIGGVFISQGAVYLDLGHRAPGHLGLCWRFPWRNDRPETMELSSVSVNPTTKNRGVPNDRPTAHCGLQGDVHQMFSTSDGWLFSRVSPLGIRSRSPKTRSWWRHLALVF